ncbi:histidine phosphatase family protein [Pikeienuella piscinae]|uniref:Histidine phosphatase family protein n=1 Tax=Pikeienuella piscinae TaxID=2748098 RepID=A0A7M3T7E5_9RHOB|nr:histidine phosphatase family protein [Pikeienuella piscinae]
MYVLRHGQTEWNVEGRLQGHRDSPLTPHGREQARRMGVALAARLASGGVDVAVSPLGRALQTAEIVIGQLNGLAVTWRTDPRLREIGVGQWEGLTFSEVVARGVQFPPDRDDDWFLDAPGAETLEGVVDRIGAFLAQKLDRPLVVVCHGQTGMLLRGLYMGLSPHEALGLDQPQDAFYQLTQDTEERISCIAAAGNTKDNGDEVT